MVTCFSLEITEGLTTAGACPQPGIGILSFCETWVLWISLVCENMICNGHNIISTTHPFWQWRCIFFSLPYRIYILSLLQYFSFNLWVGKDANYPRWEYPHGMILMCFVSCNIQESSPHIMWAGNGAALVLFSLSHLCTKSRHYEKQMAEGKNEKIMRKLPVGPQRLWPKLQSETSPLPEYFHYYMGMKGNKSKQN